MMRTIFSFYIFLVPWLTIAGQGPADSADLITFNQRLDDAVVSRDLDFLREGYADDFVFTHGSGRVDGKISWLNSVAKGSFIKRRHDSVRAELHRDIAILRGKLSVEKKTKTGTDSYWLRYIRVYSRLPGRWKMISHFTYFEIHLPGRPE